jgi:hypothetical protein
MRPHRHVMRHRRIGAVHPIAPSLQESKGRSRLGRLDGAIEYRLGTRRCCYARNVREIAGEKGWEVNTQDQSDYFLRLGV